jgi:hypothetical protein
MKRKLLATLALASVACLFEPTNAPATVHYVNAYGKNATPPYTNWAKAAKNIQDAVNVSAAGDEIVVTNGVYPDSVTVTNPLALRSVNGPQFTVINGGGVVQCASLTDGASLTGFTLTNGVDNIGKGGSGVWCASTNAFLTNCTLTGNVGAEYGGGAYGSTLYNCTLTGNYAYLGGGGAYGSTLHNCTLTGNSASYLSGDGGGACSCTLYNCTLTTNWAYAGGGAAASTLSNCALTGNSATNYGGGASGCTLDGCVLTSNRVLGRWVWVQPPWHPGYWRYYLGEGGGAFSSTLYNCTLSGNSSADYGGGAYSSTLCNCLLSGNTASGGSRTMGQQHVDVPGEGGGAYGGTLYNCTLTGNSATNYGGGAFSSTLYNCIAYFNSATNGANCDTNSILNYCCTTPGPGGIGNITNEPLFLDLAAGNLRLQSNSPCINAGLNACVTNSTDLDGNPRIVSGTVDIGAYEYQGSGSAISYAWLQQYGLPTDGSADFLDPDGDGMNNWQEWRCLTDPKNGLSVLQMLAPTNGVSGVLVQWQSVTNRSYWLERATDLGAQPAFQTLATDIAGQTPTTSYTDTNAFGGGPYFYRVGVQE